MKDDTRNLVNGKHDKNWKSLSVSDPNIDHNAIHDIGRLVDQLPSGGNLYSGIAADQAMPPFNSSRFNSGAVPASEYLLSKGIPGIKYKDMQSRGKHHVQLKYKGQPYGEPVALEGKSQMRDFINEYEAKGFGTEVVDQGTSNFVLFADEIAKILERNGQPIGDLAEGLKNR